jgi:starch phosphorylase
VPIGYVTNGVHLATWMANSLMSLLDRQFGSDWGQHIDDPLFWEQVLKLDDRDLWRVHYRLKLALCSLAREEARHAFAQRSREVGQLVGSGVLLDPDSLTIGFARRFATYKRADLVFHDVERLLKILTDPARPVQIVFAGKAHPADTPGKRILQEVYQTTRDPRFEGRIAFVEDYDLRIAHVMVQGVDLWLNLPREPMEASGTSGMKAALNGVPQLSTIDGWWQEGFDGSNGWAIPASDPGLPPEIADATAASRLYELLEQQVVPTFYDRDAEALPRRWLEVMRNAIRVAGSKFTSMRMTEEYVRDYYVPSILGDGTHDDPPAPP